MPGTRKQLRQRKLAWALYCCPGFRQTLRAFIPEVDGKRQVEAQLEWLIHNLYSQMERI